MISVTFLSSYEYCARKLFLEQVLKLVVIPREVVVRGSVRHQVYDFINKKEKNLIVSIEKRLAYSQILDLYKNQHAEILRDVIIINKPQLREAGLSLIDMFKQNWPLMVRESKNRAENIFNFIAKNKIYGKELWEKLTPKIESEFKIESENLKMKGVVDQLNVYPDCIVPYELKTGKAPDVGVWPGHKLQIGAYVMILEENNKKVDEAFVRYLDVDETRPVAMNSFLRDKVVNTRDAVLDLLEKKKLPDFCDNKNKCDSCSLKDKCYDERFMSEKMQEL